MLDELCDRGLSITEAQLLLTPHLPEVIALDLYDEELSLAIPDGTEVTLKPLITWSEIQMRYRILAMRYRATRGVARARGNAMRRYISLFDKPDDFDPDEGEENTWVYDPKVPDAILLKGHAHG